MKLYIVNDRDRWGESFNVVRAESAEEAHQAVSRSPFPNPRIDIEELRDGAGILWCHDYSPDTPRGDW